jgi:hypothetical protein
MITNFVLVYILHILYWSIWVSPGVGKWEKLGIELKFGALSGNNREWACTEEVGILSMSHCVVNFEVADSEAVVLLVQAISREREAK